MTRAFVCVSLLMFSVCAGAQTPADYSWSTSASSNVRTVQWTPTQIGAFLAAISDGDSVAAGEFQFLDLLSNGNLELVAVVDKSGRGFFNELDLVRRSASNVFSIQRIPVVDLATLSGAIADLDSDGRQELVLPEALTPYLGGPTPQAKYTAIFAWNGSLYEDRSASFSDYYKVNVIPSLQAAVTSANSGSDVLAQALALLSLDKAMRLSGAGKEFGLTDAQALATSPNSILRTWAAAALGDIGTESALRSLAILVADSADPSVAAYAAAAQSKAEVASCEPAKVMIIGDRGTSTINLASKRPINVAVELVPERHGTLLKSSLRFGAAGNESSLLSCGNEDYKDEDWNYKLGKKWRYECSFSTALSSLSIGDGVALLSGRRRNGICFSGSVAIEVVNSPTRDEEKKDHR